MEKSIPALNQKRSSPKHPKTKKKQQHSLKVVYITNPIKFKATASEFRALVQELTGQDADMSDTSTLFSGVHDGSTSSVKEAKVATEETVHAMHRNGSEPPGYMTSYDDVYYKQQQEMIDGFGPGLVSCHEAAAAHAEYYQSFHDAL